MRVRRVQQVGECALLVELDGAAGVAALHAELVRRRARGQLPEVLDIVPAARTVLLDGVPEAVLPSSLARQIAEWELSEPTTADGPEVRLPVVFDGPDLEEVARRWGMPVSAVPEVLSDTRFRVAFCGFAPGFGYLTGLPAPLALPRRDTPRTSVPAGSVALAGEYAGVYPRASPGGWQLVGSTDAVLWDPARESAALLAPGTWVRFVPAPHRSGAAR
ncbi:allophanate hydrolase subunit 1 [Streptomyces sp. NPDC006879]|uniref:5-oxoprolinase subunit B family protein n=1 Tax=Streptomyces sp. NPDC006879 TaxID=3364767 RepID=UPI0036912A83